MESGVSRLVIAGMPRSGTTLLATLISAQRDCLFLTDYLQSFPRAARRLGVRFGQPLGRSERLVVLAWVRDELLRLGHPLLAEPDAFGSLAELHRRVMDELGDDSHSLVGHKMVVEPEQLEQLLTETDLFVIVMMRDPRDAALSYWHRVGRGVEPYIDSWRQTFSLLREHQNAPRLLQLRFEDLITRPEATLDQVSRLVGVKMRLPTDTLHFRTSPSSGGTRWEENSAFRDVDRRFDSKAIGRWRDHLGSPVVRFAAWSCEREIPLIGYPPTPDGVLDLRDRLRFTGHAVVRRGHERLRDTTATLARRVRNRLAPPIRHRGDQENSPA